MKPAVVLLSGGLDSATALAIATAQGFRCHALSFEYGQRNASELQAARRVARSQRVAEHQILRLELGRFGGSALTDARIAVPETRAAGIPVTYVPARNTIFLSHALAWAETLASGDIFIGVNAVDYPGYPDCRPEYLDAFAHMANLATRHSVQEKQELTIHAPLLRLSKADIITKGTELGIDYSITVSCYQSTEQGHACGRCDACHYRRAGFQAAGIQDPTRYA